MNTFPYTNNSAGQSNLIVNHYQAKYSMNFQPGYIFSHETYNEGWKRPQDNARVWLEIAASSPTFIERYTAKAQLMKDIRDALYEG